VAFGFAIAANVLAAIASALTGPVRRPTDAAETLGAELAAVAADGGAGLEPSELVVPDPAQEAPGATRTNGQPAAISESGRKKPG
jgi:hypothetical protein